MNRKLKRMMYFKIAIVMALTSLMGCTVSDITQPLDKDLPKPEKELLTPQTIAAEGVEELRKGRLTAASTKFNEALNLSPSNSGIHFLNGMSYHLRSAAGDESKLPLAKKGYELALKFDKSNWLAQYHLGLLHLDNMDFLRAQETFAEALLMVNDDPDLLYHMAYSSYFAQDLETATAVVERLNTLEPESERTVAASAMIAAASGQPNKSKDLILSLEAEGLSSKKRINQLKTRIDDWARFHASIAYNVAATSVDSAASKAAEIKNGNPEYDIVEATHEAESEIVGAKSGGETYQDPSTAMVALDVVIIQTEENVSTTRGTNLLQGLQVQFGDGAGGAARKTYSRNNNGAPSTVLSTGITIPAITYSLNIANAVSDRNEILARPTLIARHGTTSTFFAGLEITAGATSGSGEPILVDGKEVGVTLVMAPEVLEGGKIGLTINAERTFLKPISSSVSWTFQQLVSKTSVEASVVMREGETLVLSGLSEKETSNDRSGTPLLQDIPLVQYLFSNKQSYNFQKSVLILVTPRRADFVYQETTASAINPNESDSMKELRAKYSDWFKPYPNTASVFHHMQDNSLYREFRTGDVSMEKWEKPQFLAQRLNQALTYLYY